MPNYAFSKQQVGIYGVFNKLNSCLYIGQSKYIQTRWKQHKDDLSHNMHCNTYFQNAWNRHGKRYFIFNVIETCRVSQLDDREMYWIAKLDPSYNIVRPVDDIRMESMKQKPTPENLQYMDEFSHPEWHQFVYGCQKHK